MGFKVDHKQAGEFEPIKPGEYEAIPVNYKLEKANSGNNRVIFDYEIRSDVEQPCKGQKILFDNFTVTEKSMWRFHAASKAAQFPDGLEFASYKEWAETFLKKPIRLVVDEREYNGKKYPEVKAFKVSEVMPPQDMPPIGDDDTPF